MARAIELLPELEINEMNYLDMIFSNLDDDNARIFAQAYRTQRKSKSDVMIFCIIGLVLVPGLQRFLLGQIGMGFLYLFTGGLCFIGSILDIVNHKELTFEFNRKVADKLAGNVRFN